MGTLGNSNYGYVMPDPRGSLQDGKGPICQQCHEDSRSRRRRCAQLPAADLDFERLRRALVGRRRRTVRNAPEASTPGTDNPGFQTFPHESVNVSLLLETDDDLCLNCHAPPG